MIFIEIVCFLYKMIFCYTFFLPKLFVMITKLINWYGLKQQHVLNINGILN